ncbi:MAG: hypothetical protein DWQ34_23970 [Planctomycetota bacterium]|nr:MAG: hypothetical protein DWQ29_17850 [Planctomycetota bacterium]REJ87709.1 MAG: hypothetical protein DWQ34_23970 [Planctomycetota bacterium]REK27792.1 MAG: hypothetical protein DWQ41_06720 [Planctomycetota bacterium]REK34418.1 MAG: hypothetical protein DWQ45_13275 [Planctomycetota bacterium]
MGAGARLHVIVFTATVKTFQWDRYPLPEQAILDSFACGERHYVDGEAHSAIHEPQQVRFRDLMSDVPVHTSRFTRHEAAEFRFGVRQYGKSIRPI